MCKSPDFHFKFNVCLHFLWRWDLIWLGALQSAIFDCGNICGRNINVKLHAPQQRTTHWHPQLRCCHCLSHFKFSCWTTLFVAGVFLGGGLRSVPFTQLVCLYFFDICSILKQEGAKWVKMWDPPCSWWNNVCRSTDQQIKLLSCSSQKFSKKEKKEEALSFLSHLFVYSWKEFDFISRVKTSHKVQNNWILCISVFCASI